MIKRIFSIILLSYSCSSWAIDCHGLKVVEFQAQSNNLLVKVKSVSEGWEVWKNLGVYSNANIGAYQSNVQQALATENLIMLRFPEGHVCGETNYVTVASAVRIFAN